MSKKRFRVGLIGVGTIAEMHVPALQAAGLEVSAVSSRASSTRVRSFAERHGIAKTYDDWESMLADASRFDALAITTWPDGTPAIVREACGLGLPTLVEKPVAWNSATLRELCALPHDRVIVGYNRRFYAAVQLAQQEARQGGPVIANLILPTNVGVPEEPDPTGRFMQEFYESVSAHGLDLTRFVLGDLKVEAVHRLRNAAGNIAAIAATLSTRRGDLVQVTCNWGTSANYSLTLSRAGRRLELLPFEIATTYAGMEVEAPSVEYPIRRYLPKVQARLMLDGVDLQQKPGFVGQARALIDLIEGCPPPACTGRLEDALATTSLCEELTGVVLGDTNPSTYH